jgi:4-coumarate--CoA ligase
MPISSRWEFPIEVCSLQTWLFDSPTAKIPDKTAFYDADRPDTHFLTFESFRLWSLRLAAGLQKAGLQPGDRVLLFSGNNLYFPIAFMGILMAGGIFTGANPGYVTRELAYQLKDADARFLICADGSLESGIEATESIGMGKERVFSFDDLLLDGTGIGRLGVKNWKTLFEPESVGRKFKWYEPQDPKDAICCLNYSSGTTGVPKGVMITHYNYVSNAKQFGHLAELHPDYEERTKNSYVGASIFDDETDLRTDGGYVTYP